MPRTSPHTSHLMGPILASGVFFVLYLTSLYNFTLFHTLAELFSIVVAGAVFTIAWNTRHFSSNRAFLFLGIAYAFVAAIDLLHVLSYKGMGFFAGYDANLPTQFWLAGRYMQGLSLLAAPFLLRRRLPLRATLLGFSLVSCALVVSIFAGVFPDAYIEGSGLTPFKKLSEYAIIAVLAGAFASFRARKGEFNPPVYNMLMASVALTALSELFFTFYVSVFGLSNLAGHFLKIAAFFLVYRALVQVTLNEPYEGLFRDLHRNEMRYRSLFENMIDGFALHRVVTDKDGRPVDYVFLEVNDAFEALTGLTAERVLGRKVTEVLPGIEHEPADWIGRFGRVAQGGATESFEQHSEVLDRWYHVSAYSPGQGLFCAIFEDITERKKSEEALREALAAKELLMREMNHRVKNNFLLVYSLLRLQSRAITDEASLRLLKEGQERLMAMSLIHDKLAQAPDTRISLPRYIRDLSTRLFRSFSLDPGAVELVLDIEDVDLDLNALTPLGLILSELISNSFKHAFADGRKGMLSIRFAKAGSDRFVLSVADTGSGIPPEVDVANSASMGRELIRMLVGQLNGEMTLTSGEAGTEFRIEFQPKNPSASLRSDHRVGK